MPARQALVLGERLEELRRRLVVHRQERELLSPVEEDDDPRRPEAELAYEDGSRLRLGSGDYVLIPAGERHRVEWTREDPRCVWLAVHADSLSGEQG